VNNGHLRVRGTGISFQNLEDAKKFGHEGCGIQVELLPAQLRRRVSNGVKMAFTAAERACRSAGMDPSGLPTVFTSSLGEIAVTDKLCNDIAHHLFPISPTRFHNSVHNTASGYWSIGVGNKHPAMAMGGCQDSFALGLLEAWSQLHTVADSLLLVCYEEALPEKLLPGNAWIGCAIAFVLTSGKAVNGNEMQMCIPYCDHKKCIEQDYGFRSPALAALPLLEAVERGVAGQVQISPADDNTWFTDLFRKHE